MNSELFNFLKVHKVFSSLDDHALRILAAKFTQITLKPNEFLFQEGDTSDSVFILAKGKLTATLTTGTGQVKHVGFVNEGETVGELGVLAHEDRTYSIMAVRESLLYRLDGATFLSLCNRFPSMMFATLLPIISRSQSIIHLLSARMREKYIVVMPANETTSIDTFAKKFSELMSHYEKITVISAFNETFKDLNEDAIKEKVHALEQAKKSKMIFYLLNSTSGHLVNIILKKAEIFYIIADAEATPALAPLIVETMQKNKIENIHHLVLLHPEETIRPRATASWLKVGTFKLHHHVRISTMTHYKRLSRFMRGKAFGLVLGGGGTRGWAHVGAIKALLEQKIPIDFIGGTSVGAIVGGCYAMNESYPDAYQKFDTVTDHSKNSITWHSLTWPFVSLFDGKTFTQSLQEVFGEIKIEDLWLPFFCISSNLTKYTEEVHRTGALWEKLRASSSIPGLVPPMLIKDEIHFDGGLLNNLPVNVMKDLIGKKSKIMAVELTANSMHDTHKYHFPPIFTLKQGILTKLNLYREKFRFPRFIDTFLRGMLVGSSAKSIQNGMSATIFINLNLRKFRLLHVNKKQGEKLHEIGYLETTTRIHQYRNKNI